MLLTWRIGSTPWYATAALCMASTACAPEHPDAVPFSVRDSAGVEIVQSFAPIWDAGEEWRVSPSPDIDISGQDDPALFRLASPRALPDGRVALFNGGPCEVRFYRASAFEGALGACGEGPGEFSQVADLWPWPGDSLLAVDGDRLLRVAIVSDDGSLGRTAILPTTDRMPVAFVRGTKEDGTTVLTLPRGLGPPPTSGIHGSELTLALARTLEDTVQLIGVHPGPRHRYFTSGTSVSRSRVAFGGSTHIATGRTRLFIGFPDRYEIRVLDPEGTTRRVIRRRFEPVDVTPADLDVLLEERLAAVDGEDAERRVRDFFRTLEHEPVMPAFGIPVWPGGADGDRSETTTSSDCGKIRTDSLMCDDTAS